MAAIRQIQLGDDGSPEMDALTREHPRNRPSWASRWSLRRPASFISTCV